MDLYRLSSTDPLLPHDPQLHGYACDYLGGDGGDLPVETEDLERHRDLGVVAVFRHRQTGYYFPAVRVGEPSVSPWGEDWRQGQAHLCVACEVLQGDALTGFLGPFSFYHLVRILEGGRVSPREAIVGGYVGEAVFTLRGRVLLPACQTCEEAQALLGVLSSAIAPRLLTAGKERLHEEDCPTL